MVLLMTTLSKFSSLNIVWHGVMSLPLLSYCFSIDIIYVITYIKIAIKRSFYYTYKLFRILLTQVLLHLVSLYTAVPKQEIS